MKINQNLRSFCQEKAYKQSPFYLSKCYGYYVKERSWIQYIYMKAKECDLHWKK